jgi:hypothetical protein
MPFRKIIGPESKKEGMGNMEEIETTQDKDTNQYSDLKLEDLNSYIGHVEAVLDELQSKSSQLPKVDEKGNSECPFAEELYAYKEEAVILVKEESIQLRPYLGLVKKEIVRCRKNLEQIRADEANLEVYETKEEYDLAREAQQNGLDHFIGLENTLIDLLIRKDELLKEAGEERNKWPLGKPRRKDPFNPEAILNAILDGSYDPLRDPHDPRPLPSRSTPGNEINSLINLGPMY